MHFLISYLLGTVFFIVSFIPQTTFYEGVSGQPLHINPLKIGTNASDKDLSSLIFRGLMKYNGKNDLVTDMADSYIISEDQKEYTFKLRKGVYWHDGVEFSSDDVIYTASNHPQLKDLTIDKLGRYEVKFTLRSPYSPFLSLLTLGIVPAHIPNMRDLQPIGTGDFRLARIKKTDKIDEVILVRVKSEVVEPKGVTRFVFRYYNNNEALIVAAKLGEVDMYSSEEFVPKSNLYNQYSMPLGSRYYAIFINLKGNKELKNKELRQDLATATPKQKIIDEVLKGAGIVSTYPTEYTFATTSALKKYDYNDKSSKKYDIPLTLVVPKKDVHIKTAEIIKDSYEKIGVHLTINVVEPVKITSEVIEKKDFDLLLLGQEMEKDPDIYTLWHSTQQDLPGLNFTGFESILADKALEEGRKNASISERNKHYVNFLKVFNEEVPAIILYHPKFTYAVRTDISGINLMGLFKSEERFLSIDKWYREK